MFYRRSVSISGDRPALALAVSCHPLHICSQQKCLRVVQCFFRITKIYITASILNDMSHIHLHFNVAMQVIAIFMIIFYRSSELLTQCIAVISNITLLILLRAVRSTFAIFIVNLAISQPKDITARVQVFNFFIFRLLRISRLLRTWLTFICR